MAGKIVGLVFAGVGLIMLTVTFFIYNHQTNFINSSKTAQGTVIDNVSHLSADSGNDVFAPLVSFNTADGQAEQFESHNQTSPAFYKIGQHVDVLYDPSNPSDAQISSIFELWLAAFIVGGIGLIFLLIGLTVLAIQLAQSTYKPNNITPVN